MLYTNAVYRGTTHPATDDPPMMVFPDTPEARTDVEAKHVNQRDFIGFCQHFEVDPHPVDADGFASVKSPCRNRSTSGAAAHNWCYRCMAGYPVSYRRLT